ncbi:DUF2867 domain-containing protein [Nocardia caishijiensis]|uniref:Uncharacterized protein DUF2867 n=1 Tax=Nocardia caishijiensis TaxID=184756 RepID=A0ABQ6YGR1_9NOCA|nr:DUF2867 domain-containing protein [Nocardia caishijiensis]KAF0842475.1 uncharacterized protein DUF2867 [Nocardia caishijiensis]
MRLPASAHTAQPWRIHETAQGFDIEDVWQFHTPGAGPDDFPAFLAALEAEQAWEHSGISGILFRIRWKLGEIFGWDDESAGTGARVTSLRTRLPADLKDTPVPAAVGNPLTGLYVLDNEYAAEIANGTVHSVMHLGWVPDDTGYHLRMAVLVAPNGRLGRLYMALIKPFRYLIVYPAMTRTWERIWRNLAATTR